MFFILGGSFTWYMSLKGNFVIRVKRGLNYTNDGKAVRSTIAARTPVFP